MIVLDTNIISEGDKPKPNKHVLKWLDNQNPGELYICAPILMEQNYGAELFWLRTGSKRFFTIGNRLLERFGSKILEFGGAAASLAGVIRARREHACRQIGMGDAMIAAICIVNGATLATRNTRDFDGLDVELVNPFEPTA